MPEPTGNSTVGDALHTRLNLVKSRTTKTGDDYVKIIAGAEMDRPQGVDIVDAFQQLSDSLDLFLDSSTKPKTAFIGVRISWLMFATKSDFARDACSAWSLAPSSSSSIRLRSPTSRAMIEAPAG